jgi:tagatose 6-phosphate kinase
MDRRLHLSSLERGTVNRARLVEPLPGGKAAHVAMASLALGLRPVWIGFLGGAIGENCGNALRQLGISVVAMPSDSATRINLELVEDSGVVTEVLEPGAAPSPAQQNAMIDYCANAFRNEWSGAILAISGSLPAGISADFYARIITTARAAGVHTFLDTSGEWLVKSLAARPGFVKINSSEAQIILKGQGNDRDWAVAAARELVSRGAQSAAITLGKQGIVWLEDSKGPAWSSRPPEVKCPSSVGSGDTTLAGFAHAAVQGLTGADALKFATACGAANCLARLTGRISPRDVETLMPRVVTQRLA